ncbi:MAG: CAP domain-containing protein [Paracoccaceae bacterium]|nr:CAP domain-containing protein [Paracoccaceae bacterium]
MIRLTALWIGLSLLLVSCGPTLPTMGPDGKPMPRVYRIHRGDTGKIEYRFLDAMNQLRSAANVQPVQLSSQLNAAAATHSRDMSVQNRPWHFGSDGSSPIDRVARTGYQGRLLGENISETYETELETLAAWMTDPNTRGVILDKNAREIGFAWFQEPTGKIWWTLVTAR